MASPQPMAGPAPTRRRTVPPSARTTVGWLAALLIVVGAAFAVGRIGGTNVPPAGPTPSVAVVGTPMPIAFGTGLDPATGAVATDLVIERFTAGDRFAYSIQRADPTGSTRLYVEVVRSDDEATPVQTPAPLPFNPPGASVFAYDVPADRLLADFGTGRFVMRIYEDPASNAIAVGSFELIDPASVD